MSKLTGLFLCAALVGVSASAAAAPRDQYRDGRSHYAQYERGHGYQRDYRRHGNSHGHRHERRHHREQRRHYQHGPGYGYGHGYYQPVRPRYYAPAYYVPPRHYRPQRWARGHHLPRHYYGPSYYVDYRPYHLAPPPRGYHWIRVDNDVVLVALASGLIADAVYGLFH